MADDVKNQQAFASVSKVLDDVQDRLSQAQDPQQTNR